MKKFTISVFTLGLSLFATAQVGVNTTTPASTLDVVGDASKTSQLDGIIAPRIKGSELRAKTYTAAQTGAIIYATEADSSPAGQTINVTGIGYYYFDGDKWIKMNGEDWHTIGNAGTTVGTNFLGTTDDVDLMFKRNNVQAGLLNNAKQNTAFGVNSLPSTTATYTTQNVAIGTNAMSASVSNTSVAVGVETLQNTTSASYGNVAIGFQAMQKATNAQTSIAIGNRAMAGGSGDGMRDIGIGERTLYNNTDGKLCVAIGDNAMLANTTGNRNIAIGASSLTTNQSGGQNIAIGDNAGNSITGSGNIVIGATADVPSGTSGNQLSIGNTIYGTSINTTSAKIGVQATAPVSTLEVGGSFGTAIRTGSGTLTDTDYTVVATGNITLPSPTTAKGRIYHIYLGTSSNITVSGNISYLGGTSTSWGLSNSSDLRGVILQSDGTNWVVVGKSS